MFYLFAAVMLLVAVAFVSWPLVRGGVKRSAVSNESSNVDAFRVQAREIESEHSSGLVTDAERDQVLAELSTRLASELGDEVKPQEGRAIPGKNGSKRPWILVFFLCAFVIVGAGSGYFLLGGHDARKVSAMVDASAAAGANPESPLSEKEVLALVENLAKKMEANPDDPKGWILLARSQNALGQWAAAAKAYERAASLMPADAQLLADYADVQAMVQDGNFSGKPMELTQKALKIDPKNMKALALAGTAEMRAGNKAASRKYWERLLVLVPKDSEDAAQVSSIISEIKTGKPSPVPVTGAAPAPAPAPPSAAQATAVAPGKSVSGEITLAPAIQKQVAATDTLFVFARAATGPKMPLAVVRVPVPSSWPFKFELTDAMAMAPGMNLSSFPEVTIEARISKTGNASLQPGDLQGISAPIAPPNQGLKILIDKVAR